MQGLRRSGEDETDSTIKDRKTVDKGSLANGAVRDFRGGGGDGDKDWKMAPAATDEFEVPVRLTSRLVAWLVPWIRAALTPRAAFIDRVVVSDVYLE